MRPSFARFVDLALLNHLTLDFEQAASACDEAMRMATGLFSGPDRPSASPLHAECLGRYGKLEVPPREHCPRGTAPPGSSRNPETLGRRRTFAGKSLYTRV